MRGFSKAAVAILCAAGVGTVMAQSVERDGKVVSQPAPQTTVAQAQTTAPIQTAQAGGASGGASTGGAAAAGGLGTVGTVVAVGVGLAMIVVATDSDSTSGH